MATLSDFDGYQVSAELKETLLGVVNSVEIKNQQLLAQWSKLGEDLTVASQERGRIVQLRRDLREQRDANLLLIQEVFDSLPRTP